MPIGDVLSGLAYGGAPLLGGALFGPAGAVAGGGIGSVLGDLLGDYFKQSGPQDQIMQELMQQYRKPYDFKQVDFAPIAQGEMNRFQQDIIPSIAERFTGNQRSSAFGQQLGAAGSDLASRLAELKSGHQLGQQQAEMQAQGINQNRMGALSSLLGNQQAQQQNAQQARLGRYAQFAGMLPKTMLDVGQNQQSRDVGLLNALLQGLSQKGNLQQSAVNQATQASQVPMGQSFDVTRSRQPTNLENLGRAATAGGEAVQNLLRAYLNKQMGA